MNTLGPPYWPAFSHDAANPTQADPTSVFMVPQTHNNIGDLMTAKGLDWAWYAGGWQAERDSTASTDFPSSPNSQAHHQPFNDFQSTGPGTAARTAHLRDGGLGDLSSTNTFLAGPSILPTVPEAPPRARATAPARPAAVRKSTIPSLDGSVLKHLLAGLDRLDDFDDIIDVRTPLEYADDHLPGALNAPVFSNEERARVGTLYRQAPFEATRLGAALAARNIANHLDTTFAGRPQNWRPLVYCWRGGKRSGSMTVMFNMIGWRARQLDGGYKTYRRATLEALDALPTRLRFVVLTGPTGSGKTRLLHALAQAGAQTLDLEALAAHRGSLLGARPGMPQPTQKGFDTQLAARLRALDAARPVFVEAESRKIGAVALPDTLLAALHQSACIAVSASREDRSQFLQQDYAQLFDDPASFKSQLQRLVGLHSRDTVGGWLRLVDEGRRTDLARELIDRHYDPAYARSSQAHFTGLPQALPVVFRPNDDDVVAQARALLDALG